MGLQTVPAYISASGYQHPTELDRNIIKALFGKSGLVRYGDFTVTGTGVAHQLSVAPGAAVLVGSESNTQGAYFAWSNASENLTMAAPNGTNPRIDTLLLRVKDSQYGTISGSPAAYWDIVQGVPAASPTARLNSDFNSGGAYYIPGAWYRIADIRRNTTDTTVPSGNITLWGTYVRTTGGNYIADDAIDQSLLTGMTEGDRMLRVDQKIWYKRQSGAWVPDYRKPFAFLSRVASQTITQGNFDVIHWDTAIQNPFSIWSSGNDSRIIPNVAGIWGFKTFLAFGAAPGWRTLRLRKNGSIEEWEYQGQGMVGNTMASASGVFEMNGSTDYVEAYFGQGSSSLDLGVSGKIYAELKQAY